MRVFYFIALSVLFIGCGKNAMPWDKQIVSSNSVAPAEAELYSYEIGNYKCSTGEHSFETMGEICQALLDNDLNNNCVEQQRKELHASNCAGV